MSWACELQFWGEDSSGAADVKTVREKKKNIIILTFYRPIKFLPSSPCLKTSVTLPAREHTHTNARCTAMISERVRWDPEVEGRILWPLLLLAQLVGTKFMELTNAAVWSQDMSHQYFINIYFQTSFPWATWALTLWRRLWSNCLFVTSLSQFLIIKDFDYRCLHANLLCADRGTGRPGRLLLVQDVSPPLLLILWVLFSPQNDPGGTQTNRTWCHLCHKGWL